MPGLLPHAGHQRVLAPPARETVSVAFAKNWELTLCNVITSSANKTTEHKVKMNRQQRACADQALSLTMCPQAAHSTSLSLKLLTCKNGRKRGTNWPILFQPITRKGCF